jgi:hypothetical protein
VATVRRYRTEVVIPPDRALVLHLPEDLPEGRAIVMIQVEEEVDLDTDLDGDGHDLEDVLDVHAHDMEWWEEFEDEPVRGS